VLLFVVENNWNDDGFSMFII